MVKKFALIFICLQVLVGSLGGFMQLFVDKYYVLPLATNLLNIGLVLFGILVLVYQSIKSFPLRLVIIFYATSILFSTFNILLLQNASLNIFQGMVVGDIFGMIIDGILVFFLVRKLRGKRDQDMLF